MSGSFKLHGTNQTAEEKVLDVEVVAISEQVLSYRPVNLKSPEWCAIADVPISTLSVNRMVGPCVASACAQAWSATC